VNSGNKASPSAILNFLFFIVYRFERPPIAMATVEPTGAIYKTSL
jgi:hypothetical protein